MMGRKSSSALNWKQVDIHNTVDADIFLDNIQFYDQVPQDIGIESIKELRSLICQDNNYNMTVLLRNYGTEDLDFSDTPAGLQGKYSIRNEYLFHRPSYFGRQFS